MPKEGTPGESSQETGPVSELLEWGKRRYEDYKEGKAIFTQLDEWEKSGHQPTDEEYINQFGVLAKLADRFIKENTIFNKPGEKK